MKCKICKKEEPKEFMAIECPQCYINGFNLEREKITKKLEKFERYIKKLNFQYPNSKKNMIFNFHETFKDEMEDTETGKKWRVKIK